MKDNKKKVSKGKPSKKYPLKPIEMTNKEYESSIPKFTDQLRSMDSVELNNELGKMDDLNSLFASETSNPSDVVKELFSGKNIKLRTDLNAEQISIIARLEFLATEFEIPELEYFLNEFIILRVSKDRLSRKEFVDAHRLNDDANKKAGIFSGFGNMFNKQ